MDIGKAITFVFEDPEWLKKVAIGVGLTLLGIIFAPVLIGLVPLMMVTGYRVLVTRNVMDGLERPLPEWDDWGELLVRGLKLFVIQFIWALPLIILSVGSSLPGSLAQNSDVQGLLVTISVCCGCLSALFGIAYALIEPVITYRFARTDKFESGFEFGKIFSDLRDHIGNIIIAVIVNAVAAFVLVILGGIVGTLALVIGLIVTIPAASLLSELIKGHLYGQVGRQAETLSVEPIE